MPAFSFPDLSNLIINHVSFDSTVKASKNMKLTDVEAAMVAEYNLTKVKPDFHRKP
jgi:hypothetical protein